MSWKANKSRYPVSSFGPELMELLIRGSKEEVVVPCTSKSQMRQLQARIHQLRAAMGRENHPQYATVTRARTSQGWKLDAKNQPVDFTLTVRPQDQQFAGILEKAGIKVDPLTADLLTNPSGDPAPAVGELPASDPVLPRDPYERFK